MPNIMLPIFRLRPNCSIPKKNRLENPAKKQNLHPNNLWFYRIISNNSLNSFDSNRIHKINKLDRFHNIIESITSIRMPIYYIW